MLKRKDVKGLVTMFAIALCLSGCQNSVPADTTTESTEVKHTWGEDAYYIELSKDSAKLNDEKIEEFDFTWHCDPSVSHDEVEDAPAEYYTGAAPNGDFTAYIDHELYYYPSLPVDGFTKVNYDGEQEWAYYYTDGEHDDYIFATLPALTNSVPTDMMHTEEEALQNKVLHIKKPGTYVLSGEWDGQVWVDLDTEDTFIDEESKVTLVLNNADINCSVAPGVVFKNVYECDNTWGEKEDYDANVNTENAGATVLIADGSENAISGKNIFRMLKPVYKDEKSTEPIKVQKKQRKMDGALYSFMTMNILGESENSGKLTVNSGFEGIDSELHLSVYGGNITVESQDDGMNVNEDHVSVIVFYGGEVTLNAAKGAEGDGVDSNGFIKINGGTLNINGIRVPDNALDSEDGIYYESGDIIIDGEKQNYEAGSVFNETGGMNPGGFPGGPGGNNPEPPNDENRPTPPNDGKPGEQIPMDMQGDFDIKNFKEKVNALPDDATIEDVIEILNSGKVVDGAVVTKDVPERTVVGGVPAKVIKTI